MKTTIKVKIFNLCKKNPLFQKFYVYLKKKDTTFNILIKFNRLYYVTNQSWIIN